MIKDNRTIIEITSTYIKVLQVSVQRNNPILSNLEIIETKKHTEPQIIEKLSRLNLKTKNTLLVLPKRNVILKNFSLPSQNEDEIKKILSLKILQEIPFSQEEIVFDHLIVDKLSDGYTKVLAAISPLDQISTNLKILKKAGLNVTSVLINSFGIIGWFRQLLPQEKKPISILNLDCDGAELCFCAQGKFLFSRNFNFNLNDLNDQNIADILNQIELTHKAYQNEFPKLNIEKIFIASDIFQIETLKKSILDHFNLPVEVIKPSERITCELQALSLIKNNPMISITGSWGFVVAAGDHQIDLMPRSLKIEEQTPLTINRFLPFLLSASILLVLIVIASSMGIYQKYLHLERLQKTYSSIQETTKTGNTKLNDIRIFRHLLDQHLPMADVLRDIYLKTPAGITFRFINFNRDYSFTIDGVGPSQEAIKDFQQRLTDLPWFKDVNIEFSNPRQYNKQELFDYRIACQIIGPEEFKKQ